MTILGYIWKKITYKNSQIWSFRYVLSLFFFEKKKLFTVTGDRHLGSSDDRCVWRDSFDHFAIQTRVAGTKAVDTLSIFLEALKVVVWIISKSRYNINNVGSCQIGQMSQIFVEMDVWFRSMEVTLTRMKSKGVWVKECG